MINIHEKSCLECGGPFRGRADKKFCSDPCRSAYNNKVELDSRAYMRQIHYILKKNRRILSQLKAQGKQRVSPENLKVQGFDFNYFTSYHKSHDGSDYYYCYDQGICQRRHEEKVVLVQKEH
jgi:hypothetical protein